MCYQDSCHNKPADPSFQDLMNEIYPEEENIIDIVDLMQPAFLTDDESASESSDVSDTE